MREVKQRAYAKRVNKTELPRPWTITFTIEDDHALLQRVPYHLHRLPLHCLRIFVRVQPDDFL